ncbi:MAG: peptidylprolyl isomerase, partial [Spirochaetia bacterium]|nr:peptidylprolyl isomerase [Spirochaetia bacterium]
ANVSDEQLKDFVEQRMNVSWSVYADRSKTTLAVQRYIRKVKGSKLANIPAPSDEEVKRFYDENTKQFFVPKRVSIDHIYVDTRGLNSVEQQKALERINGYSRQIGKSSAEFDKLVELSDDSASKYNHGRFGTLRIDDSNRRKFMGEDFFDTVFNLRQGDISPVIKSNVGYHIVRVVSVNEPQLLEMTDKVSDEQNITVKDTIVQYLTARKQDTLFKESVREVTDDLKKKATIKYFL